MSSPVFTCKVVINTCYGGYGLSRQAVERLYELGVRPHARAPAEQARPDSDVFHYWMAEAVERWDPRLVQVVEELGAAANGSGSQLKVVELSAWLEIHDRDGKETAVLGGDSS